MTRLWQKYALVLILAALLPLGLGAWRLASSSSEEVVRNAQEYQLATGDAALTAVLSWLDMAMLETRTVAATLGNTAMSAEDRMSLAQSQLMAATKIDLLVVYSPAGE